MVIRPRESPGQGKTVNQSMFTEVEVANHCQCRAYNNLCPTLYKRTYAFRL